MTITDRFLNGLEDKTQIRTQFVLLQARKCLLDYLGVTTGGMRFIADRHPESLNTFLSRVFIHAFCAHVLELDDGHRHGMIHLGATIVSAVLAAAEQGNLSSNDVLRGIVMGYEVAVRCARAIQPGHKMRGYHVSGTCGTIGSAMGIAFACSYTKEQVKSTLVCAVSSAAGLLEIQEQASEMKPYNLGRAAYDGVLAAQIGRMAMPGPDDILGGKRGFLATLTDTPHSEYLTDFSDESYAIEGIYQKVHAACRHCHPAIDATLDMQKELKLQPVDIDKIEVHTYKLAVDSHDHVDIRGISSAKLSTPYAVALAIVKGSAGYADYNDDNLNDYWIKNLTQKVRVIEDNNLTAQSPSVRGARVIIYMKDGNEYDATCLFPKGEPENPLSQKELENKFRGLAMYGGLTSSECDELINEVWKNDFDPNKILGIVNKKLSLRDNK